MKSILIVEDDFDIAAGIADSLASLPYELDFAYRGDTALQHIEQQQFDLILLDLNLPGLDGLAISRHLQKEQILTETPVLMMTANDSLEDKLLGFQSGAWDYLAKPFSIQELIARINVLLALAERQTEDRILSFSNITIKADKSSALVNSVPIDIHATGLSLLYELIKRAPETVTTQQLCRAVWLDNQPDSDPLRANIYRLRKLLEKENALVTLQTVKSVGYKLVLRHE